MARCPKLSGILLKRRLFYMAAIPRKPDDDVLRESLFEPSSFKLKQFSGKHKRGRPRVCWANEVFKHAVAVAGSQDSLGVSWQDTAAAQAAWQMAVQQHCESF
ncbi:unnamed protein product [Polarella glacialis]|uniref:Uncharacterized protein n=1 Tax=Polarella glacialis TaxID=89957 RepID=A0A813EP54_POLGL|nr:unnamed protein product [Polarella glacialis]